MSDEQTSGGEVVRVQWRRADGTTGEYEGHVRDLGHGIPRRDSGPGVRRAVFDLAFGYVSGFPVRDILAFVLRSSFREGPVLEATAEEVPDDPQDAQNRAQDGRSRVAAGGGGSEGAEGDPRAADWCSQCGKPYAERACGPTHAVIAAGKELGT